MSTLDTQPCRLVYEQLVEYIVGLELHHLETGAGADRLKLVEYIVGLELHDLETGAEAVCLEYSLTGKDSYQHKPDNIQHNIY